jgi:hypothetical protein
MLTCANWSRPGGDVQRAFKELIQTTGGLKEVWAEGLYIRRDIEEYLDSKFLSNSYCQWNIKERMGVKSKLLEKADNT